MTYAELAEVLVRAAYLADKGDLPELEGHYRIWRHRYARVTAAVLRNLAEHPVYEPASPHLRALAEEVNP